MKDLKSELAELERAKKGKSPFVQSVIQKKIDRLKSSSSKTSDSGGDRKSTRLNSSHLGISYAVFCLKKKKTKNKKQKQEHSNDILIKLTVWLGRLIVK